MESIYKRFLLLGLLAFVSGEGDLFVAESIVSQWPTDMALQVGQAGRINFTLLPNKDFTLLSVKAVFVGETVPETIYQATQSQRTVTDKFKDLVEKIDDHPHDLRIKDMTWLGAGEYNPSVTHPSLEVESKVFKVIALDKSTCSLSKTEDIREGDYVNLDCSTQYTGDVIPKMKWTDQDGRDVPAFIVPPKTDGGDGEDKPTTPPPTVPKKVVYRANLTAHKEHDWRVFSCHLYFDSPITYTDGCNASFGVKYPVSTIMFTPDPTPSVGYYKVGDTVNCSAIGNPAPTFSWLGETVNGPEFKDGPTLVMKESMVGGLNNFRCRAKNKVEQEIEISRNITFHVTHVASGGSHAMISAALMSIFTVFIIKLF